MDVIDDKPLDNLEEIREQLRRKVGSKFTLYRETMNPELAPHLIYSDTDGAIPEHERICFTKLRTSSHSLAVETGRWSRIPREERMCTCGTSVQTEAHVLLDCTKSADLRVMYTSMNFTSLTDLFRSPVSLISKFIYQCIKLY